MRVPVVLVSLVLVAASLLAARPAPAADVLAGARSGSYAIDASHSTVLFRIKHMGVANFYGRFNELDGSMTLDADDPTLSRISLEVAAESVDTNSADRDGHVRSPDFFAAEEHPVIAFETTGARIVEDGLVLEGTLDFRGQTKDVEASVTFTGAGPSVFGDFRTGFEATLSISRSEFGSTAYGSEVQPPGADRPIVPLSDRVDLVIAVEAILQ